MQRDEIIDQIAYLAEELRLLAIHIDRRPAHLLHERPYDNSPSIRELFIGLGRAEAEQRTPHLYSLWGDDEAFRNALVIDPDAPVAVLLTHIAELREQFVAMLRSLPPEAWKADSNGEMSLLDWLGRIIAEDTRLLREAAHRLYETSRIP